MRSFRNLVAVGAVAGLVACGGGGNQQVRLNGAGATFPYLIYQQWIIDYNNTHDDVEINYQSIGSGAGVRQFSDGTVDFGASDGPMTDEEVAAVDGAVHHIPTVLGAVVPTYNLPGVAQPIRFTPDALAGIFLGEITRWNDPRIASANPGVTLPAADVVVVHRSDGSGTTYIWADYLTKVSSDWASRVGTGRSINWPAGIGARGNEGVTASVSQTPNAIGYVELGYALLNDLPVAHVQNREGNFVAPSIESVTAAAAGAMVDMGPDTDFRVSITNPSGPDSYPITSFTWLLIRTTYPEVAQGRELVEFVWWALSEGRDEAAPLGYAPIPEEMLPWINARLQTITANGEAVWSGPSGSGT
jgi:phosphate transport system substrate-binding protein